MTPNHRERARVLLYDFRRPADAERAALDALTHEPNDPYLHVLLAESRRKQRKFKAAEAAARTAVGLDPEYAWAYVILGIILHERGRYGEALPFVSEAIRLHPENPDHYEATACTLLAIGRIKEAARAAEGGLYHNPVHVGCLNRRAVALAMLGRKDEANQELERALSIDPDDPQTHCNLGWLANTNNHPRAAIRHYREALRLNPTESSAVNGLRNEIEWISRFAVLGSVILVVSILVVFASLLSFWLTERIVNTLIFCVLHIGAILGLMILIGHTGRAVAFQLFPAGRKLMTDQDRFDVNFFIVIFSLAVVCCLGGSTLDNPVPGCCGPFCLMFMSDYALCLWRELAEQFARSPSRV